ncbi:hypothetical protein [Gimesia panareensis]|uniref:hypothetical protein n=1 Tax=Gimesia panareensis TaxID=2527978 RepID=UPI0011880916|nr:hypothetical protein [Gimesia panareensis]QDU50362.1 hypothetical protein Pan110_27080 [Gimesia panareensis]
MESYSRGELLITGSFDFAYYHEVEVEFREVTYLSLPVLFWNPHFRLPLDDEIEAVRKFIAVGDRHMVFCIEAESDAGFEKIPFYVVAESVVLREGTVYYYEREHLEENERIADWVKRKS